MRIVPWQEFLALPEGTVFCILRAGEPGALCVKGESRSDGCLVRDLCRVQSDEFEYHRRIERMRSGRSYPLNEDYRLDRGYGAGSIQVFEPADVDSLAAALVRSVVQG